MRLGIRGQGATEYLVLLAVVLIIALVSIALLGFFPGLVPDATITQSAAYWQSAKPFAIKEAVINSDGTGSLVLMNNDASRTVNLLSSKKISLGGVPPFLNGVFPMSFTPGETKTVTWNAWVGGSMPTCPPGTIGSFNVTIIYSTSGLSNVIQYSGKDLVVRCQ